MKYFRVTNGAKTEWLIDEDLAQDVATEWARAATKFKLTSTIAIDQFIFSMRDHPRLLAALNGQITGLRCYMIGIDNGVITVEQRWNRRRAKVQVDAINSVAHPTHRHADWIATIHRNPALEEVFRRAPDANTCLLGCMCANIDVSDNGHKLTPSICTYCWEWVNSVKKNPLLKVKKTRRKTTKRPVV